MKQIQVVALMLLAFSAFSAPINYYPSFTDYVFTQELSNEILIKQTIKDVLNKFHVSRTGKRDVLVNHCGQKEIDGVCYTQKVLGYNGARKILFGKMFLIQTSVGATLTDVYCKKTYSKASLNLGRNKIPNHTKVNCEHTWPQSKFSTRFPKEMQKSDLNHLFPTVSRANSVRGNLPFADVDVDFNENLCEASHIGLSGNNARTYFEPPREHKGNVARALFYFSMRYNLKINNYQERYLRRWHKLDPVDSAEIERNDIINDAQGNRNPFVDYPALVNSISNF